MLGFITKLLNKVSEWRLSRKNDELVRLGNLIVKCTLDNNEMRRILDRNFQLDDRYRKDIVRNMKANRASIRYLSARRDEILDEFDQAP